VAPQRLAAALAARAAALAERVAAVRAPARAQPDAPDFVRAIIDFSLRQLTAEQRWLSGYRESLGGKKVTVYDVKKELKTLYAPRNAEWVIVDVPPTAYLAIDGEGDPNSAKAYSDAVAALYSVAYTIKFSSKDKPFVVAPLEGLWWADDPGVFASRDKAAWKWTMLISLPPWITPEVVQESKDKALAKKKLAAIDQVRLAELHEGASAQLLHTGSYDDEGPTLAHLHNEYLSAHGLELNGLHHEIYLSDARRTEPAKLKTILRQPVRHAKP
jgi:hypothetical protein